MNGYEFIEKLYQCVDDKSEGGLAAFLSDDAREGIRAFLEKRPPRFGATGD